MAQDNLRVAEVLSKAEKLVSQLDQTVHELVELLRNYQAHQEDTE